jgi:hypothetical protein
MKEKIIVITITILLSCLVSLSTVNATLITSSDDLATATVIDFSQFSGTITFTTGPVEIGDLVGEDIIWQTNQSSGTTVIGDPSFGLGNNGSWDSGRNGYTALNLEIGYMDYLFANPVNSVGGFISYGFSVGNPEPNPSQIIALDKSLNTIESYNIYDLAPIIATTLNDGAFRGITRTANDIYGFRVSNSFIVLDDLTYTRVSPVPEPTTFVLLTAGLIGIGVLRRKKH